MITQDQDSLERLANAALTSSSRVEYEGLLRAADHLKTRLTKLYGLEHPFSASNPSLDRELPEDF